MQSLLASLKSVTDVFNLGRLVFYSFAGALVVIPLFMIKRLIASAGETLPSLGTKLAADFDGVMTESIYIVYLVSTVCGFLIASIGFVAVLGEIAGPVNASEIATPRPVRGANAKKAFSTPFYYPLLHNKEATTDDYYGWLIAEYYRYVEIVTFIPMGAIGGLCLLDVYVLTYLIQTGMTPGNSGISPAHATFVALVLLTAMVRYRWWPVWLARVVAPIVRVHIVAKCDLITNLEPTPPPVQQEN